jgi:photosystem II stability/assembly factor-like uncharacterized protein
MNNLELLERLGIVDPPDLQVTARVAAALDGAASAAPAPGPRRHRRSRARLSTLVTFVASFIVLAVATVAIFSDGHLTAPIQSSWSAGHTFRTSGGATIAPRHGTWTLMDDNVSGTWQQNDQGPPPGYLTCPDASTCFDMSGSYASDSASAATSESVYSSNDFGSTWTVYPMPSGFVSTTPLVCPDDTNCAAGGTYDSQAVLVTTSDGGDTFTVDPLPSGVGTIYSLACPSPSSCRALVATRVNANSVPIDATLLSTNDDGLHFIDQPIVTGDSMEQIACSTSGSCTAIGSSDAGTDEWTSGVAAVTNDGGRSWSAGAFPAGFGIDFSPQISCADALHCSVLGTIEMNVANSPVCGPAASSAPAVLPVQSPAVREIANLEYGYAVAVLKGNLGDAVSCMAGGNGEMIISDIASTSDGGLTWNPEQLPSDVPQPQLNDISCPSVNECWVSGSDAIPQTIGTSPHDVTNGGSSVLLGTTDAGSTWSRVLFDVPKGAPDFAGQSFLSTGSISCPSVSACAAHGTGAQSTPSAPMYTLRIASTAT